MEDGRREYAGGVTTGVAPTFKMLGITQIFLKLFCDTMSCVMFLPLRH